MKGFISYAHDDFDRMQMFQRHLFPIEQKFELSFWADLRITAGQRWDPVIKTAIDEANVFVLLMTPSYVASRYIREVERPAIATRVQAVGGLVCCVILTRCAWEQFVGDLQVVPTKHRRVVPIVDWRPEDHGYDQARVELESAIHEHFKQAPKPDPWFPLTPLPATAVVPAAACSAAGEPACRTGNGRAGTGARRLG